MYKRQAHYRLGANIDLSGYDFAPIGNEAEGAFSGVLDGAGYTISNLNITEVDYKYAGLVGYLEGTVKNIVLSNADIYGTRYMGGIAAYGEESSLISGCTVSGEVKSGSGLFTPYAGGIVGYMLGDVDSCATVSYTHLDVYKRQAYR